MVMLSVFPHGLPSMCTTPGISLHVYISSSKTTLRLISSPHPGPHVSFKLITLSKVMLPNMVTFQCSGVRDLIQGWRVCTVLTTTSPRGYTDRPSFIHVRSLAFNLITCNKQQESHVSQASTLSFKLDDSSKYLLVSNLMGVIWLELAIIFLCIKEHQLCHANFYFWPKFSVFQGPRQMLMGLLKYT